MKNVILIAIIVIYPIISIAQKKTTRELSPFEITFAERQKISYQVLIPKKEANIRTAEYSQLGVYVSDVFVYNKCLLDNTFMLLSKLFDTCEWVEDLETPKSNVIYIIPTIRNRTEGNDPLTNSHKVTTIITSDWVVLDDSKDTIAVFRGIQGTGSYKVGNFTSINKNTEIRIQLALGDLFTKVDSILSKELTYLAKWASINSNMKKDNIDFFKSNLIHLNDIDKNGNSLLSLASYYGSEKIVKYLLESSLNINHKNKNNITPLIVAATNNKFRMALLHESNSIWA